MNMTFAFFHLPPVTTTFAHYTTTTPAGMTHTLYSFYNYGHPLASLHISKLLLIILLPLALYHNLPFQNNTWLPLKHRGSGSGSLRTLWLCHDLIQCYNSLIKSLQWRAYPRHIVLMRLQNKIFFLEKLQTLIFFFFCISSNKILAKKSG